MDCDDIDLLITTLVDTLSKPGRIIAGSKVYDGSWMSNHELHALGDTVKADYAPVGTQGMLLHTVTQNNSDLDISHQ